MSYERIYTFRYDFWQEILKVLKSLFIGFLIVLALLSLTKTNLDYSRTFISVYFILGMLLMPIFKRYIKKIIYSFDFAIKRILIIGENNQVKILKNEFKKNWYLGQKYSKKNYDSVIIVSKGLKTKKLNTLIEKYLDKHSELFVVPYLENINFIHSNILEYSNIRLNTIQVENKLLIKRNIWVKSIFDLVVSSILMPFFLIIHIVISTAIKLDSKGSIFFRQRRLGKNDNNFEVYKYRTMHEHGVQLLEKYLNKNPQEIEYYKEFHKYKNDPRITKVGKILRTTSLDELPQLINVLKGNMSLIGPRPYMVSESDKLKKNKHLILKVKPGITGLWQVSGRNDLTFSRRNSIEVWYIKNWSLWADAVILFKTIKVVLSKIGAK
ncbi:Undecaprenyl-phosphate galactosephosphotransferase [hydrothermal vent metagenome]|uniref:Undecaprenyl-phosphate galactosephosphotransferase n=1 Tax=hydrothermal vent metagenome TaxID=652676 RepID=A0A3B1E6T2_9ZZZZ